MILIYYLKNVILIKLWSYKNLFSNMYDLNTFYYPQIRKSIFTVHGIYSYILPFSYCNFILVNVILIKIIIVMKKNKLIIFYLMYI